MALGMYDITTELVYNALGIGVQGDVHTLCTSSVINRWSYYKPVNGAWPADGDVDYYFGIKPNNNWEHRLPVADDRLGDFRGYEHAAKPPFYVDAANGFVADLYPNGNLNYMDIAFIIKTTAFSGSVSISDINLDQNYACIKLIVGGQTYYKTYSRLGSVVDSETERLSAAIIKPPVTGNYQFSTLPYAIGTFVVYFGYATDALTGWVEDINLPTGFGFYSAPDSATATTVTTATTYTFTVHNWIWLATTSGYWNGTNLNDLDLGNVESSLNGDLISKPTWMDFEVWDTNDSAVIAGTAFSPANYIHIKPNSWNTGTATRTGNVVIGNSTDNCTINIFVSQEVQAQPPVVNVYTTNFSNSQADGSVTLGSTDLTYSVEPTNVGLLIPCTANLEKNGVQIDTQQITVSDNQVTSSSFTLSVAADYNDVFNIYISTN